MKKSEVITTVSAEKTKQNDSLIGFKQFDLINITMNILGGRNNSYRQQRARDIFWYTLIAVQYNDPRNIKETHIRCDPIQSNGRYGGRVTIFIPESIDASAYFENINKQLDEEGLTEKTKDDYKFYGDF